MQRATQFVDEIRSSLEFYTAQTQGARIERLLISGGGSKLDGFIDILRQRIPVTVEPGRVFSRVGSKLSLSEAAQAEAEPLLATAVGLGDPLERLVSQVNLLPPEILASQRQRRLAGVVALAGVGVIGLILVFYVLQLGNLSAVRSDIEQQEQTNQGLQREIEALREFEELRAQAQAKQELLDSVYANEISFSGLLMDVSRVIPSTAALTAMTATSQEPTASVAGDDDVHRSDRCRRAALDYDTVASWLTRLERVRGWVNPWVNSIADPENGPITYTSGVDLTEAVVTERGSQAGGVRRCRVGEP